MPSGVRTSPPRSPHSVSAMRRLLFLLVLSPWIAACVAEAGTQPPSEAPLCEPGERVQFSCRVGAKIVSLCATGEGQIDALVYRYGVSSRVELEYFASESTGLRFQGTVMPAAPRAQVRQVWFDRGGTRYLLSQCVGGSCPYAAGLAVIEGDHVLMNRRCDRPIQRGLDVFSSELVRFGSDVAGSHSNTTLLQLGEYDNLLEQVYPIGGQVGG